MQHGSFITVNLGAIDENVRAIRRQIGPSCRLCAVVKANAYGLGAVRVARQLKASGVDMLAVFEPSEAMELFDAGVAGPVLVLVPVWDITRTDDLYRALVRGTVHLTVHSRRHVEQLARVAERYASPMAVHLELDTGMARGGCLEDEAAMVLRHVAGHRLLQLAGVFTHFARARDCAEQTQHQLRRFERFVAGNRELIPADVLLHVANTAATMRGEAYHQSMVRVGLAWAGYGPEMMTDGELHVPENLLRPSVCWRSRIVLTKDIAAGETVGYGGAWTARRRTRLGLIPVGYADGLPMMLRSTDGQQSAARVGVQRGDSGGLAYVPIVGALSMDQITVDLTEVPEAGEGAEVELFGNNRNEPNYLPAMARAAGVIPHVLLAGIGSHIPREYACAGPVVETVAQSAAKRASDQLAAAVRQP